MFRVMWSLAATLYAAPVLRFDLKAELAANWLWVDVATLGWLQLSVEVATQLFKNMALGVFPMRGSEVYVWLLSDVLVCSGVCSEGGFSMCSETGIAIAVSLMFQLRKSAVQITEGETRAFVGFDGDPRPRGGIRLSYDKEVSSVVTAPVPMFVDIFNCDREWLLSVVPAVPLIPLMYRGGAISSVSSSDSSECEFYSTCEQEAGPSEPGKSEGEGVLDEFETLSVFTPALREAHGAGEEPFGPLTPPPSLQAATSEDRALDLLVDHVGHEDELFAGLLDLYGGEV